MRQRTRGDTTSELLSVVIVACVLMGLGYLGGRTIAPEDYSDKIASGQVKMNVVDSASQKCYTLTESTAAWSGTYYHPATNTVVQSRCVDKYIP